MAITYPLTPPSSPGNREIVWSPRSAVGETESPFTYDQKTYVWDGQQRFATVKLPPLELADAKSWSAFILKLNGTEGTFYLKDSSFLRVPRGAVSDSYANGRVMGGSQTGESLITDGWSAGVTGLFKAGDYISLGDRLYTVLDDVNSNGSGEATLTLWPFIRTAPADNAVISVGSAARGIFKLTDWPEFAWDVTRLMQGFSFTCKEDLSS